MNVAMSHSKNLLKEIVTIFDETLKLRLEQGNCQSSVAIVDDKIH